MATRTKLDRRTTDRIEDAAAWILIAVGLLTVLLSYGIGAKIHNQVLERGRVESAERTPAVARLLSASTMTSTPDSSSITVMLPATWQDRSGSPQTGVVVAPRGLPAGSTVRLCQPDQALAIISV